MIGCKKLNISYLKLSWVVEKTLKTGAIIAVYILFCILYSNIVVPEYSFGGFNLSAESRHELVFPVLILLAVIVPSNARNINDLFILLSVFFLLIPSAVLCSLQGSSFIVFIVMVAAMFSVTIFWRVSTHIVSPLIKVGFDDNHQSIFDFWLPFAIVTYVLTLLAFHVDFEFRYKISEIYKYRFDFNDSLEFPLNYLLPFAGGPLVSYLAALSISRREWGRLALIIVFGILFYGFSTHKAFLFYPFFAIMVFYAIRLRVGLFYILAILFSGFSILALMANGKWLYFLGSIFADRLVFIPAQIHYVFFKEFSKIGFLYWSESKISMGLSSSPISINSVHYIAQIMTGDCKIGANVGWIANGYMNLGITGIVIYSAMLGVLFSLIDQFSYRLGDTILIAAFSAPILNIVSSNDLLIALLTGGVLPFMIILWILQKNRFIIKL